MGRSERVDALIAELSRDEKADLVVGRDMWTTHGVPRLDIGGLVVTDGPNGARGSGIFGTGTPTACVPAGAVLGATWDRELLERVGALLGDEAVAKGCHVLLAPTINLHRHLLGGRNFECYSEDPYLTGALGAAFVRGVQSRGVATTPKHLAANDSEFERNLIDVQVDERTLREVYLVPFEMAVKEGGAWGVMAAYNRLNGTFCSEHEWLLSTVLRQEWGFDGFVISDWFAARSTVPSVAAGLSLEMPGEGRFYGPAKIGEAIEEGQLTDRQLDAIAADVLGAMERTGALDRPAAGEESPLDRPEDRQLAREAAAAGTVLLRNSGVLPLDATTLSTLAVIGPNAAAARIMGGGSAKVRAYRETSLLTALRDRLGADVAISYAEGCNIDRRVAPLGQPLLDAPLAVEYFAGHELDGGVLAEGELASADFVYFGAPAESVPSDQFSMRAVGRITPQHSGEYAVKVVQCGRTRVKVAGQVVVDATEGEFEQGDDFFGFGSAEIEGRCRLEAGVSTEVVVEFSNRDSQLLAGAKVGLGPTAERDLLGEARVAAQQADVALVVVGTNDDWETEGRDRENFELPGRQGELVAAVADVNPNTIVVVNAGGPHGLEWLDLPAAVLHAGFGGQEMGDALVDVLTGVADPGGRMPTSIPRVYEHSPALLNYPGENSVVRYGEGLHIGHRWFDLRQIPPAVPFGFGLSYAEFEWGSPQMSRSAPTQFTEPLWIEVEVTNVSARQGSEVVQVYVEPPPSRMHRPLRELKGFAKLQLGPGESQLVRIELSYRAFAHYDPGDPGFEELASAMPVPAEAGKQRRTEPGWYVEPGTYLVHLGRSSTDFVHSTAVDLDGSEARYSP